MITIKKLKKDFKSKLIIPINNRGYFKKHKTYRLNVNVFIFLCSFSYFTTRSQILIQTADYAFENQLPFNAEFIKAQKIKSITFDILDKKDLQVAVDKGLLTYYEFNSNGLLSRFYNTSIIKSIEKEYHTEPVYHRRKKIRNASSYVRTEYVYDTVSTTYFYNSDNKLKLKRYNDGPFYESYYYQYLEDGKLESEKRCKETNVSGLTGEFKLGAQFTISDERYQYVITGEKQIKKIHLNDEGRPYKETIYKLNEDKKIIEINEQYVVTWIFQTSSFTYNEKGQLTSAKFKSNSNGETELSRSYEYDKYDCLLTEKHFKNEILLKEISYITDSTKKITSFIVRDPNIKNIRIVKLSYQY